jgi:RNA polymerase primary sigma factor
MPRLKQIKRKPRASPSLSATSVAVGTKKKGGDGRMWVCSAYTREGKTVKKWTPVAGAFTTAKKKATKKKTPVKKKATKKKSPAKKKTTPAKKPHYFECYYAFLDADGKTISQYVWSSPENITQTKAKELVIKHSKQVASKGKVGFPKPKKQVYTIEFYKFKRRGSGAKSFTKKQTPSKVVLKKKTTTKKKSPAKKKTTKKKTTKKKTPTKKKTTKKKASTKKRRYKKK